MSGMMVLMLFLVFQMVLRISADYDWIADSIGKLCLFSFNCEVNWFHII